MPATKLPEMLDNIEAETLLMSLASSRYGGAWATKKEFAVVLAWAQQARFQSEALRMALKGKLAIDVVDGEVRFKTRTRKEREEFSLIIEQIQEG